MKDRDFDKMAIAYDETFGKGINPEAAEDMLETLKRMSLSMKVHPDCEEHSEFYDMVMSAEEVIKKAEL